MNAHAGRLVITGGTVARPHGERRRRRRRRGRPHRRGRAARARPAIARARRHRLHRVARPRRPARPPARARQGGGRDHRDRQPRRRARRLHRRRRDAEHRPGAGQRRRGRLRPRARASAPGCARCCPSGCITIGRDGEQLAPYGELSARRACTCSPTTATACRTPQLDAPRARVRQAARHRARPALRGQLAHQGRRHARGLVLQPPRPARLAGARRGADAVPRHRARAPHRRADALPAPQHGAQRRAGARRQGRGPARSPPRPRRTTSRSPTNCSTSYDAVYKVNPPLRTADDIAAHQGRPRRRHHRRHRHRPRAARAAHQGGAARPGAARHARAGDRAGAGASPSSTCRCAEVVAAAQLEAGGDRRRRRPSRSAGRGRASRPTWRCSTPPPSGRSCRRNLASKSRNTPYAGRTVRGKVRHTVFGGDVVVESGRATR